MKKTVKRWQVVVVFLIILQLCSLAVDKTLFISGTGITRNGAPVTIDSMANFSFSHSLYYPRAAVTDDRVLIDNFAIRGGAVDTLGSGSSRNVMFDCVEGNTISVRVWTPRSGVGNYYADTSIVMNPANWGDSSLNWNWSSLALDYKADAPYTPVIYQFDETTRSFADGRPAQSTLTVYSRQGAGTDGIRNVTGHAWKFWQPADVSNPAADEPRDNLAGEGGSNLTLDSSRVTAGRTYAFRVYYTNEWVPEGGGVWSSIYTHQVSGSGGVAGGGIPDVSFTLVTSEAGLGLNSMGVVHTVPFHYTATSVQLVSDLVGTLNTALGSPTAIRAIGWVRNTRIHGYMISYSGDRPSYTAVGDALPDGSSTLERGQAIQVYTTTPGTVRFSQ